MIFKKKNSNLNESADAEQAAQDEAVETQNEENQEPTPDFVEGLEEAQENTEEEKQPEVDPVKELETALQEEKDRVLRLYAELDNVRRRASRELLEERKYSGMEIIRAILPVMDNLQRALDSAAKTNEGDPLFEGVQMIYQQMTEVLKKNHCTRVEALDQPFDPNFHEAISQMPNPDVDENTVIYVTQEGYLLHDRVVRPAQVVVSKKP